MGRGSEFLRYAAFLIILVMVSFGSVYVLRAALRTQYPLMVVVSQSMVPTLGVGDFILVGRIDDFDAVVAAPQPRGDILVYESGRLDGDYIVHRAVEKFKEGDTWTFVTHGDNNPPGTREYVPESQVVGRVVGNIPILGYFPLFIKTLRGFLLVASFMGVIFFSDYLMPVKKGNPAVNIGGKFPWVSLLPFIVAPMGLVSFWFVPRSHPLIEAFALAGWYIGCFVAPLAFRDDDLCLMFWLYDFVLLIIPLGCDLIWWMTGITPSLWWQVQGSTIPLTWLLMKETALFSEVYITLLTILLPGGVLFLLTMMAKRNGFRPLIEASSRLRNQRRTLT